MSDSIYSFRAGPTYRGATQQETLTAALEMPMSRTSTFFDQAKGGILESFGLGTAIRDISIPEGKQEEDDGEFGVRDAMEMLSPHPLIRTYELAKRGVQSLINDEDSPALSEDAYKSSAWYREGVPWDQAMTEQRAAALAESFDAKKVREFYAEKRPITAFIGNLAGQAADPINYIPVAGPAVKAAAVARLGKVAGASVAASLDAAANTAIFGIGTAQMRQRFGDDVSWQTTVSQIATAALIGAGFGAIGGALGRRGGAASRSAIEERLATLKTTQEARIALNEGIDALVRGEDVRLSPNATEPLARVQREIIAYHGSPHTFDQFSRERIGTGEGAQAYGRGLYFAEKPEIAKFYQETLSNTLADDAGRVAHGDADFAIMEAGRAVGGVGQRKLDELSTNIVEALRNNDDVRAVISTLAKTDAERAAGNAMIDAAQKFGKGDPGSLYEVGIKADTDDFLDWDKPLSEQSDKVQSALKKQIGDWERFKDKTGGEYVEYGLGRFGHEIPLMEAGIPGIKYLDASSRGAGEGSRNFVVFDDGLVSIRSRNGQPIDTTSARADPPPEGLDIAEKAIAKPDDYKAMSAQYRVDPETGTFSEEADIAQLATEGRLTEEDAAVLADAQAVYDDGAAYGEALKSVAGCLI